MALRLLGMRQPPDALAVAHDALELVIGLERIAAGFDEGEHALPHSVIDPGIGQARTQFGEQFTLLERRGAGTGHDMLREHVEPAGAKLLAVTLALVDRFLGRGGFEEFEAISGNQQRPAGLVEPVVGTPDTLQQPRRALGRPHLHDEVDIPPVDAKVEAGCRHERTQFAPRHRPFDLAPRLLAQRPVVDADGERILVHIPQVLEDILGQEARVGEDQRGAVLANLRVELRDRPGRRMAAPGHTLGIGQQDLDLGGRACLAGDQFDRIDLAPGREPFAKTLRIGERRGERHALHRRSDRLQPGQRQCQQVAALAGGESMDLVDHDPLQPPEQLETVGIGQQQRQAFGRGQQHMRRARTLALLAVRRGVPAACLDPDRQANLADRCQQIALHVMRQCLQRRDIERV